MKKSKKPKKAVKGEDKEARVDSASPKPKDKGKGKKTKSFKAEILKNDDGDSYFDLGNNKRVCIHSTSIRVPSTDRGREFAIGYRQEIQEQHSGRHSRGQFPSLPYLALNSTLIGDRCCI